MVIKWKWNEETAIKKVLLGKNVKTKLFVLLKRQGDYGRDNDYMLGEVLEEAWNEFKNKHNIVGSDYIKRELIDIHLSRKLDAEISTWATKWGLLEIVFNEYLSSRTESENFSNLNIALPVFEEERKVRNE